MVPLLGLTIVLSCVLGGYVAMGGKMIVLWQPWEFVIIAGASVGAFVIGNTGIILKRTASLIAECFKGARYDKKAYVELLVMLNKVLKTARTHGLMELEKHIENPFQSELLKPYKSFLKNRRAVVYLCDYLRQILMSSPSAHALADAMDEEIATLKHDVELVTGGLNNIADSLPAIGIVAAVLGVIKTMGAMSEPPAVLGKMIAAALLGTFLGVFLSYGVVAPLARRAMLFDRQEEQYFTCIREALVAFVGGAAPSICSEQGRKVIFLDARPTFYELEAALQKDR